MAAAAGAVANMGQYLNQVLDIQPAGKRNKFADAGVTTMNALVRKDFKFASKAAMTIRKSTTGADTARDVSLENENRINQLVLYCKFRYMVQRDLDFASATLENLQEVSDWFNQLENDPEDDLVSNFTDNSNKKEWFESINAYLGLKKGKSSGVPLLYVIREERELPDPADDPGFNGYPSLNDELARRGRLAGHFYRPDNNEVWTFLRNKCHGTTSWTTIVAFERTKNGRAAYLALKGQFLGADAKALALKRAEKTLQHIRFDGRSKNWTFNKFIGRLREAFLDMGPDNELSEERKVNKLMQAWQVQSLQHLHATVSATPRYKGNFDACVNFLSEQLTSIQLMNDGPGRNINSVTQTIEGNNKQLNEIKAQLSSLKKHLDEKKSGNNSKKNTPKKNKESKYNPSNPGAYVPKEEWDKMTEEQKAKARASRNEQGIKTRKLASITTGKKKRKDKKSPPEDESPTKKPKPSPDDKDDAEAVALAAVNTKPPFKLKSALLKSPPVNNKQVQFEPSDFSFCAFKTTQREETYNKKKAPQLKDES